FTSPAQTVTVTNLSPTPSSYGFMPQAGVHASGCTGFVAPGTSCPVSVTINSPAVGAQNALLRIIDSNSNLQVVEADWTGTSGVAFFTDGVINNHIFQVVGTTTTVTGQVLNSGSDTLNVGQVFLTGSPPATISNDGCSNTVVAAGHSCTFLITATPTVLGNWATTITVPTDAAVGPNPAMMVLDGSAFPPDPAQAVFSPASVTFPNQPVGTVATQVVWLDNGLVPAFGAQSLTVSSTALGGPDASAYSIVWDGCSGTSVDAAFSCPVEVAFAPAAGGAFSASLLFNDNASGSPQAVALVGVGAAPATVSPLQVDFGQVGVNTHSAPVTVTLTNTSTATFSVSRVTISGLNKGDFTVASDGCSHQTLAPGQACQVTLDFRPEASGDRSATVTFEDTAANSPQSAPLTGVGIGK
ncbi:MAG TPA: choice-of-anchor D domain-containing protein, partial [Candidatus Dormibacteraeota bacterium]|nr:choice-of-anchor D domain-containing protein [Candidatus Dormibacteraeota bacterium]